MRKKNKSNVLIKWNLNSFFYGFQGINNTKLLLCKNKKNLNFVYVLLATTLSSLQKKFHITIYDSLCSLALLFSVNLLLYRSLQKNKSRIKTKHVKILFWVCVSLYVRVSVCRCVLCISIHISYTYMPSGVFSRKSVVGRLFFFFLYFCSICLFYC